ncbi:SKI/DACH domain-containing protein 1-like [Schistocerca gregaria]|uniref:SKI/DACH domain-containing protein 1-like n=1 Tax=Schistocerca gregaria TaxID=7010 RepID=UPI00211DD0F8|nr:SKI/DACH domain-containing protein 1-like [Schistocerca gregaria]
MALGQAAVLPEPAQRSPWRASVWRGAAVSGEAAQRTGPEAAGGLFNSRAEAGFVRRRDTVRAPSCRAISAVLHASAIWHSIWPASPHPPGAASPADTSVGGAAPSNHPPTLHRAGRRQSLHAAPQTLSTPVNVQIVIDNETLRRAADTFLTGRELQWLTCCSHPLAGRSTAKSGYAVADLPLAAARRGNPAAGAQRLAVAAAAAVEAAVAAARRYKTRGCATCRGPARLARAREDMCSGHRRTHRVAGSRRQKRDTLSSASAAAAAAAAAAATVAEPAGWLGVCGLPHRHHQQTHPATRCSLIAPLRDSQDENSSTSPSVDSVKPLSVRAYPPAVDPGLAVGVSGGCAARGSRLWAGGGAARRHFRDTPTSS